MDFVARKNNRRDIRRSLGNLPRQLSDVYEAALRRIANQNQEDTDLAERLLSWIVCARRPLTRVEVQHALAVEQADKRLDEEGIPDDQILIAACAGLVTVDRESSIIRPVHYTAQKYFEAAFASRLPRFRVAIASACLTYLSFDDLGDACELDSLLRRYALLPYAAQYWGDHVRGEPEAALREEVVAFCRDQPHITTWYRVLHRLRHGYELDAASLARVTGLHAAALLGLPETVASLLRFQDVDINALDIQGETPLHWAAAQGHEDVVGILLGHATVDANRSSLYGRTPLSLAAEGGHAGVVSLLVARKDVDPDQNDPNLGITPLWIAADRGHIDVVRLLLGHAGVDVNVKDKYFGETPLWRAANKGHEEVVREILKRRDVNVGVRDRHYGEQPLDRARAGGYKKIIEMLETHEGAAPDHYYT
ncbi:Ankyrin repeat and SAM domain-containing protein 3 [Madurella mycetomatis]|uniref:Ankyrin repeat and SAM domain-containing protein 3 n=1 Tax=Madurella mycetomatis TaxID=100816 RepID=A0A175W1R5_9PEZI|nr:Ankyrin repeat and SAM domain-containing protein 3 [Madurella mycetomatis]